MSKNKHHQNDLYYGLSSVSLAPHIQESFGISIELIDTEAITMGRLNNRSGITSRLANLDFDLSDLDQRRDDKRALLRSDQDSIKGYFNVLKMLKENTFNPNSDNVYERWLAFLKQNIDYLSLDKEIRAVSRNELEDGKDLLMKNLNDDNRFVKHSSSTRNRIIEVLPEMFKQKNMDNAEFRDRRLINPWMRNAFFRRTSKLGIDFAIQEGKRIHFCLDLDQIDERSIGISNFSEFADKQNEPVDVSITQSELRYINRKYGFDHPQIDFFVTNSEGQLERLEDLGKLSSYLERRETQGRANKRYDRFKAPNVTPTSRTSSDMQTTTSREKRDKGSRKSLGVS